VHSTRALTSQRQNRWSIAYPIAVDGSNRERRQGCTDTNPHVSQQHTQADAGDHRFRTACAAGDCAARMLAQDFVPPLQHCGHYSQRSQEVTSKAQPQNQPSSSATLAIALEACADFHQSPHLIRLRLPLSHQAVRPVQPRLHQECGANNHRRRRNLGQHCQPREAALDELRPFTATPRRESNDVRSGRPRRCIQGPPPQPTTPPTREVWRECSMDTQTDPTPLQP